MNADKMENLLNYEPASPRDGRSKLRWLWWVLIVAVVGYGLILIDWIQTPS
jgi:hypothetical protein